MTAFDPLASSAPLIVYLDIKSPYAFIAKDPTWALLDELNVAADIRPLTLDIPSYLGSARLDKKGKVAQSNRSASQWSGIRYAYMDARRYASAFGYELRGTEKIWNTRLIHIAMLWVKREGSEPLRAFLDIVYPRFWVRALDVEDEQVVLECITRAGVATAGFLDWAAGEGGELHDSQQAQVFEAGVYGVPGYIFEGQYFFGREHLSTIRSRMLGEPIERADVANPLPSLAALSARGEGKHNVFLDMQRAAAEARLQLVVGVNPACAASQLASATINELLASYPAQLSVQWVELPVRPSRTAANMPEPEPSAPRGDRHRAYRARYEAHDLERYSQWRASAVSADSVAEALGTSGADGADRTLLLEGGVSHAFGFVYIDGEGTAHPFVGRQHLGAVEWALKSSG